MFWYLVFAILYLVVLAALLVFIAGASKLAKQAEAEDRMCPHRNGPADLHIRDRYRDAA
jgi:uncharacterized membrane protein